MKKILVTGGAGYIGSIMTKRLLDESIETVVVDDLERSDGKSIDPRARFIKGNLLNTSFVDSLFINEKFDGIIFFAGYISMGESMENPYIYFQNNIYGALNVLEAMRNYGSNNIIFSSTAGVYGNPTKVPIPEDHEKHPTNPYGESKLMVEHILNWYNKIHNISSVCLRYFNASGALLDASLGEHHKPETHIIPKAIESVLGEKEFHLFGTDYKTPDGTAVRDYIHVLDLAKAHMLALHKLHSDPGAYKYNVGTGVGHSNKEIIKMVEKISGKKITVKAFPRRAGDAEILIADPSKINNDLHFKPEYSDLETIVKSAWDFHIKQHR